MTTHKLYIEIEYDDKDFMEINAEQYIETEMMLMVEHTNKNGYPFIAQLTKTLQNEAIDQAFRELSERINNHSKRLHDIEKVLEDANLWSFEE